MGGSRGKPEKSHRVMGGDVGALDVEPAEQVKGDEMIVESVRADVTCGDVVVLGVEQVNDAEEVESVLA